MAKIPDFLHVFSLTFFCATTSATGFIALAATSVTVSKTENGKPGRLSGGASGASPTNEEMLKAVVAYVRNAFAEPD